MNFIPGPQQNRGAERVDSLSVFFVFGGWCIGLFLMLLLILLLFLILFLLVVVIMVVIDSVVIMVLLMLWMLWTVSI